MNHAEHSASAALTKALDSYAGWLDCHFASGNSSVEGHSGASLLHAVAEIRRHSCPGSSDLMTNMLLDHTRLSALLFEHQLKLVRGEPTESLLKSQECIGLVQRQTATILAMRTACTAQRAFCIHTAPAAKTTPTPFVIRPITVTDEKRAQR